MASDDDQSVARYVLAYMIDMNYTETTAAFLQECECLKQTSSTNVMILPKTPLKLLINDYQSRQNTDLMIKTIGSQQAWKSLWGKLQQTLEEINTLAHDAIPSTQTLTSRNRKGTTGTLIKAQPTGTLIKAQPTGKLSRRSQSNPSQHTTTIQSPVSPKNPLNTLSSLITQQSSSASCSPHTSPPVKNVFNYILPDSSTNSTMSNSFADNRSPRKKRVQTPKKRTETQAIPSVPGSSHGNIEQTEDVQHLLESLMSNEELPWRLAELINQHATGSGNPDNPGSSSSPHTNTTTPNHTKPASDSNEGNIWLDQLINSVFPIDNSLSKTPPPNQDPIEAVSAEVVSILPHDGQSDTHSNGSGVRNHKRPLTIKETSNGGQKRPRTDQSNSSVRLPDGVNLEQFLDQIHK